MQRMGQPKKNQTWTLCQRIPFAMNGEERRMVITPYTFSQTTWVTSKNRGINSRARPTINLKRCTEYQEADRCDVNCPPSVWPLVFAHLGRSQPKRTTEKKMKTRSSWVVRLSGSLSVLHNFCPLFYLPGFVTRMLIPNQKAQGAQEAASVKSYSKQTRGIRKNSRDWGNAQTKNSKQSQASGDSVDTLGTLSKMNDSFPKENAAGVAKRTRGDS